MTRFFFAALVVGAFALPISAAVTPGEMLIGEMNCVACHSTTPEITTRLNSKQSPNLGGKGVKTTPQWLMEFLANPQKSKPGTSMPDMLHGLDAKAKSETVEALTHYLMSIQPTGSPDIGAQATRMEKGKKLYHETGCVQCHAPQELPPGKENDPALKAELEKLATTSAPLGNLAKKFTVGDLATFLCDPLKSRPAGRMPSQNLNRTEAENIAMYLLRDQKSTGNTTAVAGLQYEYYEQSFTELPVFDRLTPTATGVSDDVTLAVAKRQSDYAIRFRGFITIPEQGYKFYTYSKDGSRLYIDDKLIIENGGVHTLQEVGLITKIPAGTYPFEVQYFNTTGAGELVAKWKTPGMVKGPIPPSAFTHGGPSMVPHDGIAFTVDPAKAARGAELFRQHQCSQCHQTDGGEPQPQVAAIKVPLLEKLTGLANSGCTSATPKAGTPKFTFSNDQRAAIEATLKDQSSLATPLIAEEQVHRTMSVLNCSACHTRDKTGGAEGLRRDYLVGVGEVDLGDEGRIPPHLEKVAAKLNPKWLREVVATGARSRPYMATRMPAFGEANANALAVAFEKADLTSTQQPEPDVMNVESAELAKHGLKLMGTGGVSCIACHNFAGHASLGIPAIDLTTMGKRLRFDWFRRYLIDPQSLRPGTRMPSFWTGGVAANKDILKGDTEKQIAAIWANLARNDFKDLPDGLIRAKMELVPQTEALIYRNFIEGAGSRAIGVGYPERANLAFDANESRFTLFWQGAFMDASRHRTGRGDGFEKPLGRNFIQAPDGPAFAILEKPDVPWPTTTGRTGGYQFKGYNLDARQRPTFRYEFNGLAVEDFHVALVDDINASFRRTITVKGAPKGTLYFRAAKGVIKKADGFYIVNEKLRLKLPGSEPIMRGEGEQTELLVPLSFTNGEAKLVQELVW